jgi:primosomal protein N' (replication factor Y)
LLEAERLPKETVTGVLQISAATLKAVEKAGAVAEETSQIYRNPAMKRLNNWQETVLNEEQSRAVEAIWQCDAACREHWQESDAVHLLHGVTGSGKTEVYMALMERVLASGRQVIVLIPEISLTLQTVSRFYARFGSQIAIMNSRLSAGERYDQYMRARRGEASIMIGPRSALFTPFDRLGLIIIDEEHENAYKSETTPKYHARDVAIARAGMAGAMVVLGSATPSVISYTRAVCGQYHLHRLTHRAKAGSVLPEVEIIDLREEFRLKNRSILSGRLREAMENCLTRGEQMMLFINRRGYAGFVSCRSCGHVMKCPHCDVSLTAHYHGVLKCHYCGHEAHMPKVCPECGSPYIAAFGVGTQKVEDFVKAEFPQATVLRMDRDTTSGKEDMTKLLQTFAEGGADILIGTQMIVKGHDFPNVTLVGVLAADLSMFSGDYMSSERTFQLLTQAAGRAGRDKKPGSVVIQTYQPEHYCITSAAAQDYERFYDQEILFRRMMHYPPETQMLMLLAEGPDDAGTLAAIHKMKAMIGTADFGTVEIIGPTKASLSKGKDMYRYVLYMKHQQENELIRLKDFLEGYLKWSGQFQNIYFNFDFNPVVPG